LKSHEFYQESDPTEAGSEID